MYEGCVEGVGRLSAGCGGTAWRVWEACLEGVRGFPRVSGEDVCRMWESYLVWVGRLSR